MVIFQNDTNMHLSDKNGIKYVWSISTWRGLGEKPILLLLFQGNVYYLHSSCSITLTFCNVRSPADVMWLWMINCSFTCTVTSHWGTEKPSFIILSVDSYNHMIWYDDVYKQSPWLGSTPSLSSSSDGEGEGCENRDGGLPIKWNFSV